jgi:ADP-heptose:LPS heptosyltransferase
MADLRRRRYDVVLDFQANCRGGLWGWITGARSRIGFGGHSQREANYIFTRTHVRPPAERLHKVEKNLALLRAIGVEPDRTDPVLPPLDGEGEAIGRWWATHLGEARPVAVVHPGVSPFGLFKRWPRRGYADLLWKLSDEGILSVVAWGPGERDEAERIRHLAGETAVVGPETPSLLSLADLIRRADLFIGSDSGPLHLASAVGTPTVALFGPKDPVRYGPHGAPCRVVRSGVDCSPCDRRSCSDPVCMTTLRPEKVLAAALSLLRDASG